MMSIVVPGTVRTTCVYVCVLCVSVCVYACVVYVLCVSARARVCVCTCTLYMYMYVCFRACALVNNYFIRLT